MEDNFDKSIRKALENFEAEYQPMDWDKMEQKMDEQSNLDPDVDNVLFDAVAYDSLHDLGVDYNPEHWDLMRERIADPYALRSRLMKYKVAEVALVALFIFTLIQFLPERHQSQQGIAGINSSEKIVQSSSETETDKTITVIAEDQLTKAEESKSVKSNAVISESYTSEKNSNPITTVSSETSSTLIAQDKPFDKSLADASTGNVIVENKNDAIENAIIADVSKSIEKANVVENKNLIAASEDTNETDLVENENLIGASLLDQITLKDAGKLSIPEIEEISGNKVFSTLKKPVRVRIGMVLGPDANYVMTPQDNIGLLNLDPFDQLALGYSGGLTLGFRYNKFEVETGAIYSAVSYSSRKIFELKGNFAEGGYVYQGLVGAELDIVRLPLNIKYNFFEKSKWNVYAFSGASMNIAVETFYDFTTQDVGRSQASSNARYIDEQNDTKEAYEGVLEGGKLLDNTFLTANLGFGIERYFTPRMSIFVQPSYMHQFSKGLGPQSDQINSISILTGAKVTLKKRKKSKK